jgi:hypothetical protein
MGMKYAFLKAYFSTNSRSKEQKPSKTIQLIVSPGIEHGYIVFPSHKNNV